MFLLKNQVYWSLQSINVKKGGKLSRRDRGGLTGQKNNGPGVLPTAKGEGRGEEGPIDPHAGRRGKWVGSRGSAQPGDACLHLQLRGKNTNNGGERRNFAVRMIHTTDWTSSSEEDVTRNSRRKARLIQTAHQSLLYRPVRPSGILDF